MTLTNLVAYIILAFTQQGYYEGTGDLLMYVSSDNAAVAGANLFSIGALPINPTIPTVTKGFKVALNAKFSSFHEVRSEPVYDQFDNTVGYAVLYSRFNNYTFPGPFALAFGAERVGIGLSFDTPIDYHYSYSFTDRLDAYTVVKRETISQEGSLSRYSFTISGKAKFMHIGLTFSNLRGKVESLHSVWTPDSGTETDSFSTEIYGNSFTVAAGFSIGYRVRTTLVYTSGLEDNNMGLPRAVDFGVELRPAMRLPTRIFLRLGYDDWSNVDTVLRNRWRVHFGTTQMLFPGTSLSIGTSIWKTPYQGLWTTTYAGGLHHRVLPGFYLNAAVTFTPRTSSRFVDNRYLKISENLTEVIIGLRLSR